MDVIDRDDPESADAGSLDLTPRADAPATTTVVRPGRRVFPFVVAILVIGAIAALLVTQLAGATTYFYNVDDAVAKRDEIGDRRVRLQGNIIKGSVDRSGDQLAFTISYNGVSVPVRHTGDVPDLFGPSIPVVIEGRFDGDDFASDRVLVKHDETYDEDNSDRIKDAERDAERNADAGVPSSTIAP